MKTPQNTPIEEDPSWDLLQHASKQTADPMFAKNIIRSIKIKDAELTPWWKSFFASKPALTALGAAACVTLITSVALNTSSPQKTQITSIEDTPIEQPVVNITTTAYDTPETLDDIIDPLMLISYVDESDAYSLDELGL